MSVYIHRSIHTEGGSWYNRRVACCVCHGSLFSQARVAAFVNFDPAGAGGMTVADVVAHLDRVDRALVTCRTQPNFEVELPHIVGFWCVNRSVQRPAPEWLDSPFDSPCLQQTYFLWSVVGALQ